VVPLGLVLVMATPEVHLAEPLPLSFLLSTPTGEVAAINTSEIIRIVDELFAAHTDLRPVLLDAALMEECRGRLICLSLKARRDYERESMLLDDGELAPYRDHVDRLRREGVVYPRYLLVLSNVTSSDRPDRMSALMIDTDLALGLFHAADRRRDAWQDELEARVASAAVLLEVRRKEISGPEQARAFMRELVTELLRKPLEEAGHYEPYGRIEIACEVEGAAISIDGTTVGVSGSEPLLVGHVRPGTHVVDVTHQARRPFNGTIVVETGATAKVEAELALLETSPAVIAGRVVFWSGIALSVAGAVLVTFAIATQDRDLKTGCFDEGDGACMGGSSFTTLGGSNGDDAAPEDVNPSGVLTAPLGYSLIGTGAAFSIGSLFEESAVPWISLVAGLVIGGTAYGLSAALDGPHL
jgi:hypothetical protein